VVRAIAARGHRTATACISSARFINVAQVSSGVAAVAQDTDLVVLEGMGRSIETNLRARFKVDALKLGMIKHPEVAAELNGRLYDIVCKFNPAP
jgi:damage-control phosphatase, subfamily II, stand-alone protein